MMKQTNAKIFLAEERGLNESGWYRSCNTFNYDRFFNRHKTPFGGIYIFNDDLLAGGHSLEMKADQHSFVLLLPVFGALEFNDMQGHSGLMAAGQLQLLRLRAGARLVLTNPFTDMTVNFVQAWIHDGGTAPASPPSTISYDVNTFMNSLVQVTPTHLDGAEVPFTVSVGKFSGRGEALHPMRRSNAGFFVFVLNGAFEVEGRLLHNRDGLALWGLQEADMEALSPDALLLAIETPFTFSAE